MSIRTEIVPFYGDEILAAATPEGVYVAVVMLCDRLGVSRQGQQAKLNGHPERWSSKMFLLETAAGARETLCIPLNRIAAWLFTLNAKKVKPDVRDALIRYQIEAADVLDRHFRLKDAARDAELEHLRMQHEACAAFAVAFNPMWSKIAALQRTGTVRSELKKYFSGRPAWEVLQIMEEMEKIGAIRRDGWHKVRLVHPDAMRSWEPEKDESEPET